MTMPALNLACGTSRRDGINVDFRHTSAVDVVADISQPLPFFRESFGQIECYHGIEHLAVDHADALASMAAIVRRWVDCLAQGGILAVEFPDIERLWSLRFNEGRPLQGILRASYGADRFPGDLHQWGWTQKTMAEAFAAVGLADIVAGPGTDYHRGSQNVRVQGMKP